MNPLIEAIPPSQIRAINALKRPDDIDLGLGEPTLPPPIGPFEAATDWTRRHGSPYSPNAGFSDLRSMVAEYVGSYAGRRFGMEGVCITVGSEEALYLALKASVDPGRNQEVLIVEPCYLAYPKICLLEGIAHRTVALEPGAGFAPNAERVLAAVKSETAMIVVNSPSNPTGRIWSATEAEALAAGLERMGRSDIVILADEVYRELFHGEKPPTSFAEFHENTLVAGSLSKSNSLTGLRLGWLVGPTKLVGAAIKVHQFVNTAASTFSQRVGVELFGDPASLGMYRDHYRARQRVVVEAAEANGVEIVAPEGAFYLFARLPSRWSMPSQETAERFLEAKRVVTVPGSAFGESGEGWLRLSWVAEEAAIREGFRRLGEFLSAG